MYLKFYVLAQLAEVAKGAIASGLTVLVFFLFCLAVHGHF